MAKVKRFPAESADVGDVVHITRERGAFRIVKWDAYDDNGTPTAFTAFGPLPGTSGKRVGAWRAFLNDRITAVIERADG